MHSINPSCVLISLLLGSFLSSFGHLALHRFLLYRFNYTHSHCLLHVADSKTSQRRVFCEGFHTHRLRGCHHYDSSIPALDVGWIVL